MKSLLVLAGIALMLAQSVVPAAACSCPIPDQRGTMPCHGSPAPAPSSCCGDTPALPDGTCGAGLDAACCKRAVAPQEENPAAVPVSPDAPAHPDASVPALDRPVPRSSAVGSTVAPPAPPGAPTWLRHAALLI